MPALVRPVAVPLAQARKFRRPYDVDAQAWAAAVATAGGTAGGRSLAAVSAFCKAAKAAGYWNKLTRINLMCGVDLTAARVPLKLGGAFATETVNAIVAGDYQETGAAGGIKGDGTSKRFSPGWNPVTAGASPSSFGMWAYVKGLESGGVSKFIMGHQDTSPPNTTALGWAVTGTLEAGAIGAAGTTEYAPTGTPATKEGFLGIATNGSRSQQYYQNGAAVGAPVVATGGFSNTTIVVMALNNAGTVGTWTTRYLRAYAITAGMSAADAAAFNAHMQSFQTALGRNV